MPPRIRILPEELCNRIAAGEVVERPASVIKELVENSLDAGSSEIRIEIAGGGKRLIRVQDNGEGMGRDDVLLCLERHATSKIRDDADLFCLHTLGFRGEALPSIASVSRLLLRSCPVGAMEGWEIEAEGGRVRRAEAIGMAQGTTLEVRDLFFNTPARRKFLRRDETELGHIGEVVTKLALAHPGVHFRLAHQDRVLIEVYRQASLAERVAFLLGRPLLRDLLPLEMANGDLRLHGLISQPAVHRSAGGWIYTYINGRYVRDRVFQHALLEGYRSCLEKGRYPMAVLFLEMAPEAVDVNVHPTKHEVRFREQARVHDFIAAAVRDVLRPSAWLPGAAQEVSRPAEPAALSAGIAGVAGESFSEETGQTAASPTVERQVEEVREALRAYAGGVADGGPGKRVAAADNTAESLVSGKRGFFSSLAILGQFRRCYILCQDGDDLLLIDQHAAHERVGFERLRQDFRGVGIERQSLLFPAVIEVGFQEAAVLSEWHEDLARLGFEMEPFGDRSFALQAAPRLLAENAESLLRDMAAELATLGKIGLVEEAMDTLLMRMACHGAVRASRDLSHGEMRALLESLDQVDFKAHCPHGRPIMVRLTLAEIERMFRRS